MSADPILQDPMNGQSYNRYSYVLNNPTNLTDPTGFASEECKSCPTRLTYLGSSSVKVYGEGGTGFSLTGQNERKTQTKTDGQGNTKSDAKNLVANPAVPGCVGPCRQADPAGNDGATIGPVPASRWTETFLGRMISDTFGKAAALFTEGNRNPLTDQAENFSGDKKAEALIMMLPMARGAKAEQAAIREIGEKVITFTREQLTRKYSQHAAEFGMKGGNPNASSTLSKFSTAIQEHVSSSSTIPIAGTYRGSQQVIHHVNPTSGLSVMTTRNGEFISTFTLTTDQLTNVLKRGKL